MEPMEWNLREFSPPGDTAPEDQNRKVSHSRYEEGRRFHEMVHDINLVDFEHRLARGEARDGTNPEEFIHFDLGGRRISLQAKVRHNGDGMDEGNLVTITVANRSEDDSKVCLDANLSCLDSNNQLVDLTKKENVALEQGKRFTLFGFKATDVQRYCTNGNLHLRLEMFAFDYIVSTEGTENDAGNGGSGMETRRTHGTPSPPPTATLPEEWGNLVMAPDDVSRPRT